MLAINNLEYGRTLICSRCGHGYHLDRGCTHCLNEMVRSARQLQANELLEALRNPKQ